jgi:hypothetical protein
MKHFSGLPSRLDHCLSGRIVKSLFFFVALSTTFIQPSNAVCLALCVVLLHRCMIVKISLFFVYLNLYSCSEANQLKCPHFATTQVVWKHLASSLCRVLLFSHINCVFTTELCVCVFECEKWRENGGAWFKVIYLSCHNERLLHLGYWA